METLESLPKDQLKNDYPRQVYPDPPYQPPEYLADPAEQATDALKSVRIVVYAGMTAFVLLAAYGFFLIYLLTSDARTMAEQTLRMAAADGADFALHFGAMNATMSDMRSNIGDMRATHAANEPTYVVYGRLDRAYGVDRDADPAFSEEPRFQLRAGDGRDEQFHAL